MQLNKTQLRMFELVNAQMKIRPSDLSRKLNLGTAMTYRDLGVLIERGFVSRLGKEISVSDNKFARLLGNIFSDNPDMATVLSNSGLPLLLAICDRGNRGMSVKELSADMAISPPALYPYIKKCISRQILYKQKNQLFFNVKIWGGLYEFLSLFREHLIQTEFNLPNNAKIYFQDLREVVFSMPLEYGDAQKTAFTLYEDYGIELMGAEWFYRIDKSKSKPGESQILLDSLRIAGAHREESSRRRLYSYLFYRKYLPKLKDFRHSDIDTMNRIFSGEKLDKSLIISFPSREEIVDKARDYDIKV